MASLLAAMAAHGMLSAAESLTGFKPCLLGAAGPGACLLWNYEEVLDICRAASNVVATISGHAHRVLPFLQCCSGYMRSKTCS